jgi:UDP-N-acetylglucosamine 3-dehydrogenase
VKFGQIGAGGIGELRADALSRSAGVEFVASTDVVPDALRAVEKKHGVNTYSDHREMLDKEDLDGVIVSAPPNFHEAMTCDALEAGANVICEKPMAATPEACRRMIAKARECDRLLGTGFNMRFFPALERLKQVVDDGSIGPLRYVKSSAGHRGLEEFKAPWMYDKEVMGGGALFDIGIHTIDLVHYVMGDIASVYGADQAEVWGLDRVEDNGFAIMRNQAGAIGYLHASWSQWQGYGLYVEAYGDLGFARASYAPMHFRMIQQDKPGGKPRKTVDYYPRLILKEKFQGWQTTTTQSFVDEIEDFVRRAQGNQEGSHCADGFDGLRSVEVANGVYESSRSGSAVNLPSRDEFEQGLGR